MGNCGSPIAIISVTLLFGLGATNARVGELIGTILYIMHVWKTEDRWNTLQAHGGCCDVVQDQRLNEDTHNALLVDN